MNNVSNLLLDNSFLYHEPWFYNNKLALRCELRIGKNKGYLDNAFRRAISIATILFENRKIDAAFYHLYFDVNGNAYDSPDYALNIHTIIELSRDSLIRLEAIDDDISAVKRYISYDIDFVTLESLLKSHIECQEYPPVSFVSFDNQFIFSVYDDRGCDIVFFDNKKFKEFYFKLEPFFLDFDREKMAKTLETI